MLYYEINTHALREDGMDYLTHNEIETEALGETLARRLGPGDVVALSLIHI